MANPVNEINDLQAGGKQFIRHVVHFGWLPVKRIEKAFRGAHHEAGLGNDVMIHTLRHMAGTWLAQKGVRSLMGPAHASNKRALPKYGKTMELELDD